MRIGASVLYVLYAWLFSAASAHATTAELQRKVRAATFEVVRKKPEHDPLTYDKPLPLELLPFIERNDAYQSIGTAFALGRNTYVTAAHVLAPCIDSQYGPPVLRAASGEVYSLARVLKFSLDQDFAVFSLEGDLQPPPLETNRAPRIDDVVVAVGNALGEGVVIREGLFTSETPEDQDGRWKWIRFSAAASPGNSGGPLLDASGRVIGIVIGKSPNENLNYALPIARVLDAPEEKATFDQRSLTTLPFLRGSRAYRFTDEFKLPLSWPQFSRAYVAVLAKHGNRSRDELLAAHAGTLFPRGPGSEALLFDTELDYLPRLVMQDDDDKWRAVKPLFKSVDLPGDGFVSVGQQFGNGLLLRLHRPNDAADDAFYANSKEFMDLALKALDIMREVGPDRVKVTSLGPASKDLVVTDRYGRKWQQRVWALPYLDIYLLGFLLPTPDGYIALASYAPSSLIQEVEASSKLLLDQFHISYWGTISQWQAFLRRRALLPAALSSFQIDSGVWRLRSPLFQLALPETVLPVNERSGLGISMSFLKNGERVDWNPRAAWWYRDDRETAYVGLWRVPRPPQSAKLDDRNRFSSLRERRSPYDGKITRQSSDTFKIDAAIDVPGSEPGMVASDIIYGLTIQLDGYPSASAMLRRQQELRQTITIMERGQSEERAAALPPESPVELLGVETEQYLQEARKWGDYYGQDLRGRTFEQDVREYIVPLMTSDLAKYEEQSLLLAEYWKITTMLSGTKEAWRRFLEKNHLPQDPTRYPDLIDAEVKLRNMLQQGPVSAAWADAVKAVISAYKTERTNALTSLTKTQAAQPIDYRSRQSACPAPAGGTSGAATARSFKFPVPRPPYPAASRRKSEEGTAVLSLQIDAAGCVQRVGVRISTGSDALDAAALEWIETAIFLPGEVDGKPAASERQFAVAFSLTD